MMRGGALLGGSLTKMWRRTALRIVKLLDIVKDTPTTWFHIEYLYGHGFTMPLVQFLNINCSISFLVAYDIAPQFARRTLRT